MSDTKSKLSFVMEMVDKVTTPIAKVTEKTKHSAKAIEATQQQLSKLGKTSADLDAFKKLKRESVDTSRALDAQNDKVAALARKMRETEKPTRAMTAEFNKAKREAQQLSRQHARETENLNGLRNKLESAGISTKNLRRATSQVARHADRLNDKLARQQRELEAVAQREKRLANLRDKNGKLMQSAAGDTAKVAAATYAISRLTDAYGRVATAQGEIKSLDVSADGIDAITRAARDFSNQWAGTTQAEFISASYDIKSGIASLSDTAVGEFTRIAALTGGATKSSTEQMTSLFASGYGIYRKQFEQFGKTAIEGWNQLSATEKDIKFGEYFSAGIASSVKVFKTDGSKMSDAISNLGATATAANVPFTEQLSILGQLQATMSGGEAATKYKAFLNSAAGAGEKLGLNFLDANNQLLSLPAILEEMRGKYGDTIDALEEQEMKKAFGTDEAMAMIKLLYPETDRLKKNIGSMNGAMRKGSDTARKMAKDILTGPNESYMRMGQRVTNLTATLGKVFAPTLMFVADIIGEGAMFVADLSERFPVLTQIIGSAIIAMIALKTVMIGVKMAQIAWNAALITGASRITLFAGLQRAMAAATAVWTAAQWALNVALNANPLGLVVMAVMALIGVVALIVKYWEPLGDFFSNLWDGIVAKFQSAMKWVTETVGKVKGWWDSIFGDDDNVSKAIDVSQRVSADDPRDGSVAATGTAPTATGVAAYHSAPASFKSENNIQVYQQPGESSDDLTRRMREELDKRDRAAARRQRGRIYDNG